MSERSLPSRIIRFLELNRTNIIIVSFFIIFTYGMMVFNIMISHDTEAMMEDADELYRSWFQLGRFGLIYFKKLIGTYWFNPYVASFMMPAAGIVTSVIWMYLTAFVEGTLDLTKRTRWILPAVFFSSPIMAEQFGFILQAYEMALMLGIMAISLLVLFKAFFEKDLKKRIVLYVVTALLTAFGFSVYQSLPLIYVTGFIFCMILYYDRTVEEDGKALKYLKMIITGAVIFGAGYVIYSVLNKVMMLRAGVETSSYITDQMYWLSGSVSEVLASIISHIKTALLGEKYFYSVFLLIAMIILAVYFFVRISKREKAYWIYFILMAGLFVSPFLLLFALGSVQSVRSEITMPLALGFMLYYIVQIAAKGGRSGFRKILVYILVCASFAVCMSQAQKSARLFYTEHVQWQEDVFIGNDIAERIIALGFGKVPPYPVVFVGSMTSYENAACVPREEREEIGRSFFEIAFSIDHGTFIMGNFMSILGFPYISPGKDMQVYDRAAAIAQDMPIWPQEGCVKAEDGIIVVRLSEKW